jgi:very-short-patch-repair endonuclease
VQSGGSTSAWWADLPRGRVVSLQGVDADALTVALDPLPAEAPVVVTYRPDVVHTQAMFVTEVLSLLEGSAIRLFPAWLPGWDPDSGRSGVNVAAARVLALRLAGHSDHFGPFLADLAARALNGRGPTVSFPPEIRGAGLTRTLLASYDRADVVLLIDVPPTLTPQGAQVLAAAAEWLASKAELGGVWLVGGALTGVDWLEGRRIRLPAEIESLVATAPEIPAPEIPSPEISASDAVEPAPALALPPLAGRPAPNSAAEQLLEKVLSTRPWAAGRIWNQIFSLGTLTRPIRVDLLWDETRTAVEVDGPEHRQRVHFADDRARDVRLQSAGYAVLRFTNDQVLGDINAVVHQLEQFITARRAPTGPEGHSHVG